MYFEIEVTISKSKIFERCVSYEKKITLRSQKSSKPFVLKKDFVSSASLLFMIDRKFWVCQEKCVSIF